MSSDDKSKADTFMRGRRADGTNLRAVGKSERQTAANKWALRNWKRTQRKAKGGA